MAGILPMIGISHLTSSPIYWKVEQYELESCPILFYCLVLGVNRLISKYKHSLKLNT